MLRFTIAAECGDDQKITDHGYSRGNWLMERLHRFCPYLAGENIPTGYVEGPLDQQLAENFVTRLYRG